MKEKEVEACVVVAEGDESSETSMDPLRSNTMYVIRPEFQERKRKVQREGERERELEF